MSDNILPVGVVIERRVSSHPWQDFTYRPIAVVPRSSDAEDWREIQTGEGWVHFLTRTLPLELHPGETEGYRNNLSQTVASIYVILRPGENDEEKDVEPFLVTACPYEAMGYAESGDEIVESVIMPDEIVSWVQGFIDQHHVDEPFRKRKNKKHRNQGPIPGLLR